MNINNILDYFRDIGVKEVVCAPGARCKELLNAFVRDKDFNVTTVYDERTAGFYALGLSFKNPTVVLTTSGTAVTELSSSMAEAFYQKDSKLIALTSDRPFELRNTGAPQSLDQSDVYKNFARTFVDLVTDEKPLMSINPVYPMHINVCLDEPNPIKNEKDRKDFGFLVVVSELNDNEQKLVKEALSDYSGALVLEPLSNLSENDFPEANTIRYSESFVMKFGLDSFSKIIRLGGVPVFKPWREVKGKDTYYWSDASKFPGGIGIKSLSLSNIKNMVNTIKINDELQKLIEEHIKSIEQLISNHSDSEVSLLSRLSKSISPNDQVFIGNSLPIREWDYVERKNLNTFGQRGVNGIDGSLAFALGKLDSDKTNWIILGDLTTLYNFSDFQLLDKLSKCNIRIVVVNNHGGQIFSKVIKENVEPFLNSHQKSFKQIAEFWGLNYQVNEFDFKSERVFLELLPNKESSESFWKGLSSI